MRADSTAASCVLDVHGTLARLGGDQDLFRDLTGFFAQDAPKIYSDLRGAVRDNDSDGVQRHAHALKGLIAGCGGVRAAQAAQKVETAGQIGDLAAIQVLVDTLGEELERLTQALLSYRG